MKTNPLTMSTFRHWVSEIEGTKYLITFNPNAEKGNRYVHAYRAIGEPKNQQHLEAMKKENTGYQKQGRKTHIEHSENPHKWSLYIVEELPAIQEKLVLGKLNTRDYTGN